MTRQHEDVARTPRICAASVPVLMTLLLFGCGGGGGGGDGSGGQPTPPTNPPGNSAPTITSFTPLSGSVGTQVIVSGSNFGTLASANTVRFNGINATVLTASATELVAVVPGGATSGPLQVITAGGTATSSVSFAVSVTNPGATWRTRTIGPGIDESLSRTAIAHNGTRFVTVGSGSFEASMDARIWTTTGEVASASDVAWNGQLFVAVGGSYWVNTSADGLSWSTRTLPSGNSSDLGAVVAGPSLWVAVGEAGAIFTSVDGITWTARSSGTSKNLVDVAWAANRFVAVGEGGAVVTSGDGVNWTLQPAPTTDSFTAVGGSSSLIVASTYPYPGSQDQLLTSVDGVTWQSPAPGLGIFNSIIHAGGRLVAAGDYGSATSIDGVVWVDSPHAPAILESVVHVGGQYVAVGIDGGSTNSVLISADGLNWRIAQSAHDLRRLARSAQDGRLVAAGISHVTRNSTDNGATWEMVLLGTGSQNYPFIDLVWSPSAAAFVGHVQISANQYAYTSVDGSSWTQRGYMPCYGALAASPTRLVNVGSSLVGACVSVSDNGASWTSVTPPSSTLMKGVFWADSQFVAVGNSGLIATSPDGQTWTLRPSNVMTTLYGGVGSGSNLVVVGADGTIVTSSDGGLTWTPRISNATATLRHAAFNGNTYLVTGTGGTLLRSSDGQSWSRESVAHTTDFGDVLWVPATSQWVLAGDYGLILTSE